MPSDRDALAALLREHGTPLPNEDYPGDEYECCTEEILAAGWRPPARVIESAEEADALPDLSVVLDRESSVWQYCGGEWHSFAVPSCGSMWLMKYAPVTILWRPEVNVDA